MSGRIRPRLLYSSIFVWISLTGGRFLAPLLQDAGLSDTQIGICFALQTVAQSLCFTQSGALADDYERRYPGTGRAWVLMGGITLGSASFLLEGIHAVPVSCVAWHLALRCIYAGSTSLVFPVLDGLTLDFLANQKGTDKADFGKERLHGAIWWAIANMVIGPSLDVLGFYVLYIYALVSSLAVLFTIVIYTKSQQQQEPKSAAVECQNTESIDSNPQEEHPPSMNRQKSHLVETVTPTSLPPQKLLNIVFATSLGVAFMLAVFCLSIGTAVVESLVFLYFEVLGSSFTLCSVSVLLTVLFEIPIFHIAPNLLQKYGTTKLLLTACFCYITRVIGYTLVSAGQPWWVLLFEPLHGVTYACASLSAVEFVSQLVPKGYDASGQGILYALKGFGSCLGVLFGGIGADLLGPRTMYRVLAAVVATGSAILTLTWIRYSVDYENLPLQENTEATAPTNATLEESSPSSELEMMTQSRISDEELHEGH